MDNKTPKKNGERQNQNGKGSQGTSQAKQKPPKWMKLKQANKRAYKEWIPVGGEYWIRIKKLGTDKHGIRHINIHWAPCKPSEKDFYSFVQPKYERALQEWLAKQGHDMALLIA